MIVYVLYRESKVARLFCSMEKVDNGFTRVLILFLEEQLAERGIELLFTVTKRKVDIKRSLNGGSICLTEKLLKDLEESYPKIRKEYDKHTKPKLEYGKEFLITRLLPTRPYLD